MRRRQSPTQADFRRMFKGAREAGVTIAIEVSSDGSYRGVPCDPRTQVAPSDEFDVMRLVQGIKL
jgi:hypothetical protein